MNKATLETAIQACVKAREDNVFIMVRYVDSSLCGAVDVIVTNAVEVTAHALASALPRHDPSYAIATR